MSSNAVAKKVLTNAAVLVCEQRPGDATPLRRMVKVDVSGTFTDGRVVTDLCATMTSMSPIAQ